jgi:CRP/FNR family transcriptional regulator, cyclic AMP receptor protein
VSDRSSSPEELLSGVGLFSSLSRRRLRKIADASRVVNHEAGKKVAAEGLGALAFHLVLEGTASVQKRGTTIRTLGPGDYFGEISMIDGQPRSATVVASEPMRVLAIPHQDFEQVIDEDPGFARHLLKTLCGRLREAEARSPG